MRTAADKAAYLREWRKRNPEKCAYYRDEWRKNNPEKHREVARRSVLKKMYRMTPAQFDALLERQGGGCAVCGTTEPGAGRSHFCIDHNHACCPGARSCGRCVRGILCNDCNQALGRLHDSPALLRRAAEYLDVGQALLEVA